jgi:hypothetical protein
VHWVIGDIHGMIRPLRILLDVVHSRDPDPTFVFAGDYVNRGPDSRAVVELLLSLDHATFCRGNHDDVMTLLLTGAMWVPEPPEPDAHATMMLFMREGLDNTLASYGIARRELMDLARGDEEVGHGGAIGLIRQAVPDDHVGFFRDLMPCYEHEQFFVAHAHLPSEESAENLTDLLTRRPALKKGLIWDRFALSAIAARKSWGKLGYFGHTPVRSYPPQLHGGRYRPIAGESMVLLDTGCCMPDGRLTAVSPESGAVVQVHRTGELL